ncbi:Type I restriction-modification system specificity subunit [gamma proteobacterium HdN1]|nr:Type I restriction-modification system specificity subunit [gamma proteobacterium HdN1]
MSWISAPLSDFCIDVKSGGTPSSHVESYYGGEIPWLRTQEVVFKKILDTELKITDEGLNNSSAKWIPENSVIVAMYGNSAGRSAVNKIPLTTNQACCNLIIDDETSDYRYVFYALCKSYEELKSLSKGAAQNNLNAAQVKSFNIPKPPKKVQEKIGDILSSYDDLIENNRRRIQLLEESARLLYQEWFVHLRFPGHEQVKIIDGVPEGWSSGVLSDFFETSSGGTPSRKIPEFYAGDIPWVKTQELNDSYIFNTSEKISEEAIIKSSAKLFPAGTVLIAMYGATIGETGVLAISAASNQACCALFPKNKELTTEFTHLFAMNSKQGLINLSQGAAQNNISQQIIRNFPFVLPSELILKEFNDVVSNIYNQKFNLERQNISLLKARDLLLPKLMSGELTV